MANPRKEIAEDGKAYRFTQSYQPSGKNKSKGKNKRKFTRLIVAQILDGKMKFKGEAGEKVKKELKENFGIDPDKKTIGELLALYKVKAGFTQKGSSYVLDDLMTQAYGQPKQEIDVTSDGKPIKQNVIKLANGDEISI